MALTLILQAKLTEKLFQLRVALNESECQEPITWNAQLPCIHVTAFSQTSLFLDWISREV